MLVWLSFLAITPAVLFLCSVHFMKGLDAGETLFAPSAKHDNVCLPLVPFRPSVAKMIAPIKPMV
jgi:hypothetical protein